jgi:transcriptional regulator of arginine metabolism
VKDRRHRAIQTLVATRPIRSQEELADLLEAQGFETTQATISRDIKELGLAKVPVKGAHNGNQFKYVVPTETVTFASRLHRVVAELVTSITPSENLIVLRTPPGSGMLVAAAVDEGGWPEIIGTLGGDDTVLAIVRSSKETSMVVQRFIDLQEQQ